MIDSERPTTRDSGFSIVNRCPAEPRNVTAERRKDWRAVVLWMRLAEFGAAGACFVAAILFAFVYDLAPTGVAHQWMLKIGSESAWIASFAAIGFVLTVGALSRGNAIRSACLAVGVTFFGGIATAALRAHAMPISTSFFLATTAVLSITFLAGPRRTRG